MLNIAEDGHKPVKRQSEHKEDDMDKCCLPGMTIKPDGINELDPCKYEVTEIHRNVTVEILRCQKCGHMEISWYRQEDTEDEIIEGDDNFNEDY